MEYVQKVIEYFTKYLFTYLIITGYNKKIHSPRLFCSFLIQYNQMFINMQVLFN